MTVVWWNVFWRFDTGEFSLLELTWWGSELTSNLKGQFTQITNPPTFLTHLQLYLVMQKVCIVVVVTYPSSEISALVLKFGLCSSQHLKVLLKQSNNAAPYNPDKSPQQSMLWKEIFLMQSFDSASITIQFTYLIRWNTTRGKENMTFVARWTDPMTGVSLRSDDTSMSECLNTECKSVFIHVWMSHMCVLFFSES